MSDPVARPLKRARLSAEPADSQSVSSSSLSSPSATLQRHPDVWFNDGNIVLVAQGTGFRIYQGLLAGQSTVFSDMFASSSSSDESFDGCPVVRLSDSPHDLAHLLRVLLSTSHIHYHVTRTNRMRTFDELSAVIRLAHKYNIQQVEEQAIAFLQEYGFPTSFAAYSHPSTKPHIVLNPAHSIGVANLAHLIDTPSLLPLALFHCVFLGSKIFDGCTHEDGSVEYLPEADLRRCFDARAVLADERTLLLRRVHDLLLRTDLTRLVNPLEDWRMMIDALGGHGVLCRPCTQELLERNRRERKKLFDTLPKIFNITVEGWGTELAGADVGAEDVQ
ncbi:hypothetical protein GSI_12255 [Ganoderma sinense ZZ0214-1]|uniref:BTB domain-containing protein n=1 Tax=Ganoderma sinense ZZ0214-1 TaxID=1077348 RepID=A0A2G8RYD8_9APHY|nr:hypothetical protein GSI_12255 [Ganoderma sinense ZZ0214-1]